MQDAKQTGSFLHWCKRSSLWVISGHVGKSDQCLLYPRTRTLIATPGMFAKTLDAKTPDQRPGVSVEARR
jgi:hypothetical protein